MYIKQQQIRGPVDLLHMCIHVYIRVRNMQRAQKYSSNVEYMELTTATTGTISVRFVNEVASRNKMCNLAKILSDLQLKRR